MKRGKIEPGMDMNKIIQEGRGQTVTVSSTIPDSNKALNAFIRGGAVKGEAMTPERAAELAEGGNYFINDDGSVRIKTAAGEVLYIEPDGSLKAPRKVPQGNAGVGTGSMPSGKRPLNFGEKMNALRHARKQLGVVEGTVTMGKEV